MLVESRVFGNSWQWGQRNQEAVHGYDCAAKEFAYMLEHWVQGMVLGILAKEIFLIKWMRKFNKIKLISFLQELWEPFTCYVYLEYPQWGFKGHGNFLVSRLSILNPSSMGPGWCQCTQAGCVMWPSCLASSDKIQVLSRPQGPIKTSPAYLSDLASHRVIWEHGPSVHLHIIYGCPWPTSTEWLY